MSIATYGNVGAGVMGSDALMVPSGGGLFPAFAEPTAGSPNPIGNVTAASAPSPVGQGSGWAQVLSTIVSTAGTIYAARQASNRSAGLPPPARSSSGTLPTYNGPGGGYPWSVYAGGAGPALNERGGVSSINPQFILYAVAGLGLLLVLFLRFGRR